MVRCHADNGMHHACSFRISAVHDIQSAPVYNIFASTAGDYSGTDRSRTQQATSGNTFCSDIPAVAFVQARNTVRCGLNASSGHFPDDFGFFFRSIPSAVNAEHRGFLSCGRRNNNITTARTKNRDSVLSSESRHILFAKSAISRRTKKYYERIRFVPGSLS